MLHDQQVSSVSAYGHIRMNRLARADVLAFHHRLLEKGYKPGACDRILAFLRIIFNCAIRWEVLHPKPIHATALNPLMIVGGETATRIFCPMPCLRLQM
jgi:hypothetical protein